MEGVGARHSEEDRAEPGARREVLQSLVPLDTHPHDEYAPQSQGPGEVAPELRGVSRGRSPFGAICRVARGQQDRGDCQPDELIEVFVDFSVLQREASDRQADEQHRFGQDEQPQPEPVDVESGVLAGVGLGDHVLPSSLSCLMCMKWMTINQALATARTASTSSNPGTEAIANRYSIAVRTPSPNATLVPTDQPEVIRSAMRDSLGDSGVDGPSVAVWVGITDDLGRGREVVVRRRARRLPFQRCRLPGVVACRPAPCPRPNEVDEEDRKAGPEEESRQ